MPPENSKSKRKLLPSIYILSVKPMLLRLFLKKDGTTYEMHESLRAKDGNLRHAADFEARKTFNASTKISLSILEM